MLTVFKVCSQTCLIVIEWHFRISTDWDSNSIFFTLTNVPQERITLWTCLCVVVCVCWCVCVGVCGPKANSTHAAHCSAAFFPLWFIGILRPTALNILPNPPGQGAKLTDSAGSGGGGSGGRSRVRGLFAVDRLLGRVVSVGCPNHAYWISF